MRYFKDLLAVFIEAGTARSQDKASLYAAAIAGRVFGQAAVGRQIVAQMEGFVGPEAAILLESLLQNSIDGSSSFTLISIVV